MSRSVIVSLAHMMNIILMNMLFDKEGITVISAIISFHWVYSMLSHKHTSIKLSINILTVVMVLQNLW